jgi:LppX_LprAFG lipoprotein
VPSRRTGLLLTLTVAATLVLAGCSGDEQPTASGPRAAASSAPTASAAPAQADIELLRRAALKSAEAGSARVSFESSATGGADVRGTGSYTLVPPLQGSIDFTSFTVGGQTLPGGMTMLMTPDAYYLRIPALEGQLGKPWAKLALADIAQESGLDLSALTQQAQQGNPMVYLELLQNAGDLEIVGSETVAGVPTTHYRGTVDYAETLDQLTPELRAQLEQQLSAAGTQTATIDVWIDADGTVRQLAQESESTLGPVTVTMTIEEYGVPVDVTPPAEEETADLRELTG